MHAVGSTAACMRGSGPHGLPAQRIRSGSSSLALSRGGLAQACVLQLQLAWSGSPLVSQVFKQAGASPAACMRTSGTCGLPTQASCCLRMIWQSALSSGHLAQACLLQLAVGWLLV